MDYLESLMFGENELYLLVVGLMASLSVVGVVCGMLWLLYKVLV